MADRLVHGRHNRGSRHGMSKLTEDDVKAIKQMLGTAPQTKIARTFSISQPAVSAIASGKRWGWLE